MGKCGLGITGALPVDDSKKRRGGTIARTPTTPPREFEKDWGLVKKIPKCLLSHERNI